MVRGEHKFSITPSSWRGSANDIPWKVRNWSAKALSDSESGKQASAATLVY